ncbi:MAG: hypothetical protein IT270_10055 [Saprospiraceae bacterium]|nr:hypothetical protein [Saprospiraceae bacterium]
MRLLFLFLLSAFLTLPIAAQNTDLLPYAKKMATAIGERKSHTKGQTVRLDYFTFENTEMGSVFSRELYNVLLTELPKAGIVLRKNDNDLSSQQTFVNKDDYVVCGTYRENGGNLNVYAYLYDLKNKQPIRYIEVAIPTPLLVKLNYTWKPEQLEKAIRTRNLIVEDDDAAPDPTPAPSPPAPAPEPIPVPSPDPPPSHGDFELALMTSKGFGHQIFTEGERMRIAVRAAEPCFLRLVYHAADGSKVLLLENVPMKVSDEGNYITVPQEFECSSPFGVETIQLFACTEVFPPLRTHKENGLIFIDEDVASVNTKTRGFKPVSGDEFSKAEVSLQVTTLPK